MQDSVQPIVWTGRELRLLDQRRLPREVSWQTCRTSGEVARSIRDMVVRGAPAIGICAAFGLAMAARDLDDGIASFDHELARAADELRATRPTAINLHWALERMLSTARGMQGATPGEIATQLATEAEAIFSEDLEANRRIGQFGEKLFGDSATILTHCNAGALATAGYGTALGVVRALHDRGARVAVFADETRPFLQGSRLTAWELQQDGIDVTLITDSMAGHFFQKGTFDAVIVGADRIAANGDTANKIGTYTVAILANAHGIPFYVAAPVSTIDVQCADGNAIPIEERSGTEVTETLGWDSDGIARRVRTAPEGVAVRHPAFDVTPARLITAIITDRGVLRPPFDRAIEEAMR